MNTLIVWLLFGIFLVLLAQLIIPAPKDFKRYMWFSAIIGVGSLGFIAYNYLKENASSNVLPIVIGAPIAYGCSEKLTKWIKSKRLKKSLPPS